MSEIGLKFIFRRQTDDSWVVWFDPSQISNHLARFAMANRIQHDAPPGFVIICDQLDQGMIRVARSPCVDTAAERLTERVQQLADWLYASLSAARRASLEYDQHCQPDP